MYKANRVKKGRRVHNGGNTRRDVRLGCIKTVTIQGTLLSQDSTRAGLRSVKYPNDNVAWRYQDSYPWGKLRTSGRGGVEAAGM